MQVDRTGTFRFNKVLEAGVGAKADEKGKTTNVSFNVRLLLSEFWDEQEGVWVDWTAGEEPVEISAYFYLFGTSKKTGKKGPTINHTQVMKVFGWDGRSFQVLANEDYSETKGQVRINENDPEYAERNPFQVAFIDVFDADPSSQLRKLDPAGLKKLDAEMAMLLQSSGAAPVAATVPAKKTTRPKAPAKAPVAEPEPEPAVQEEPEPEVVTPPTPAEKKAALKAKSERLLKAGGKTTTGPKPPMRPTPPVAKTEATETAESGGLTKQQAYEFVIEMKADECTDEQLSASWNASINDVAGEATVDEDVTDAQWRLIANKTLDEVGKF